jgi:aminoglycoside phosphotransferase (APT) family kinase protein
MNIAEALSRSTKLQDIQSMMLAGTLQRELSALLSGPSTLEHCYVRHARFRPGRKLTANYEAHLRTEGSETHTVRAMEVTWRPHPNGDPRQRTADLGAMETEAVRRGLSAPFRQLVADLPAWGMHIQVSPVDEHFPQLVRVHDPSYVRDMVGRAYAASGVAHDQGPARSYAVTSIRYRPLRRHVLRYDPVDAPELETLFAKMYAGESGERAFRVATLVADWLEQRGQGVTSLRPLAYLAEDAVVLYRRILGESLSQSVQKPSQGLGQKLRAVGVALRALHEFPPTSAGPLPAHDLALEMKLIKRSCKHVPALLPSVGASIEALLERARVLHERLPQEQPTFTHGDFLSEHVWVTPRGLVLIDLDNCCVADPALDVGKFLADLRFLYAKYEQPGVVQAQEEFLAGYTPGTPAERLIRARLYEAIKLAKMTGRRVFVFEQDWASRTERLIGRAQVLMNGLEQTLGLPTGQVST